MSKNLRNELDDWKDRQLQPLETTSALTMCSTSRSKVVPEINLLSSFLPNEILQFGKNVSRKIYNEVCFMSVKICGVIQYCEQCDRLGSYNPAAFLDSIEEYFDPIIQTISSNNGDIIKLLPGEIWSIWKYPNDTKSDTTLRSLVHEVINCGLRIQRIRDNYEMKGGTLIRVKIGISVGPLEMINIDDDRTSQWIFIGKGLLEVREAANISLPGQILLSLSNKVKLVKYFYITECYTKFIKILGIGPNWKERSYALNPPLIEGQFVASSTSSEETIFNFVASKDMSEAVGKTSLDASVLLKSLPHPLFKCLILGKSINQLSRIQALVAMHISIDTISNYFGDNIDFIDVLLKTLCSIIYDRNGFVYHTKIGALNLQAVFVFGNEDQKLEINCKEALNNALGAFIAFGKLREVKKITVAVTSGMCHCGVINNSLRRSYILVSPLFTIASKLLKLYPGKIICDKKTMLHSKLREDQFVLLEYQHMKNYEPGSIFEYIGNNRNLRISQEGDFPLLENEDNIQLLMDAFYQFSDSFKKRRKGKYVQDNDVSIAIIDGEQGQGKTKVLNAFCRKMNHKFVIRLEIKPGHEQIHYYTVRKLFEFVMNFHKNTTYEEKHSKLACLLESLDLSEFLCSLNDVFFTNFDNTEEFRLNSEHEKIVILEHVLKRLAYVCFENPYIVAIDTGDNIDEYSCNILYELIEAKICFFVVTATRNKNLSIEAEELIRHKKQIEINLKNMDFSNQTALSCQILNVYAMSSALQRFIHKTSGGNPARIEKILFNMLENNELILKTVNRVEMNNLDLVVPPVKLLQRSLDHEKLSISSQNLLDKYYASKNEGQTELQNRKMIPVCLLASSLGVATNATKTTNDGNIKHSFGGLTYDQKLVLQGASILGEAFPRSMLLYALNLKHREKNQNDIAEAIQGLFELGILCCAKNHSSEMRHFILKRCCVDISNTCSCLDTSAAEIFEHFPQYTFCQFMRFSSAHYKAAIRKLVPSVVFKELHLRALKYLHKETRRCNACGGGLMDLENIDIGRSLSKEVTLYSSAQKYLEQSWKHTFGTEDKDGNSGTSSENKWDKYPSFAEYDFTNCECEFILCSVYKQMVEHYRDLEEYTEMLKSMIRSSEICLMLKKYDTAYSLSQHGLKIVQGHLKNSDISNIHHIEGKFHNLIGQALLGLYRKEEAFISFNQAMTTLGVPFPSGNLGTFIKLFTLKINGNRKFHNCLKRKEENDETESHRTITNSLSGLFKIHKSQRKWKKAELCAIWSLKNNIQKNADFPQILESIANLMRIAYYHRNISFCKSLEQYGLLLCMKEIKIGKRDLIGVLKFYAVCFLLRFHHSKLDIALHIGSLMINISIKIGATDIIFSSIPYIVIGLIVRKKISETYSLLRKLEYHSAESKLYKGKIWYHVSTLILWLETGHSIEAFEEYELYCKQSANEVQKHASEKRKLTILMWLWYVRNEYWKKSFQLFKEIFDYIINEHLNTEKMSFYALYLFEGVLLYLVQRSKDRRILLEYNIEDEVMQVCKKFESINVPTIYIPRFMHLKAFHELCKNDEKSNTSYMEKALDVSYETENLLEIGWTEHSKRGWFSNLPDFLKDAWKENCTKKFQDIAYEKIIYFTLPVPIH